MQDEPANAPPGPTFRPRQSSYLRISPTTVLQMILYLEPTHTDWMNNDVLERMLFALRDRIPLKLAQEGNGKRTGKEKTQVDVFRGADYQMAFFFRRAYDKHVVMLKDKHLRYATRPAPQAQAEERLPSPPLVPSTSSNNSRKRPRTRSPSQNRTGEGQSDLQADESSPPPASKRSSRTHGKEDREDDGDGDLIVIKPEPIDEELPANSLFRAATEGVEEDVQLDILGEGAGMGEVKPEDEDANVAAGGEVIDEDVKPELKVFYQGYRIFGRTLVVIVEPYPPLAASDLSRPRLLQQEIRQLSASVAPATSSSFGRGSAFRSSTLSATPAPRSSGNSQPLFRERSESREGTETPAPRDVTAGGERGRGRREGEDGQMRRLREETEEMIEGWDDEDEDGLVRGDWVEEEDGLPSLDAVFGKKRGLAQEDEEEEDDLYA
ncbi:hypothetical protein JCM11641_007831 [Rhodosporidiobolus odoratus]